MKLQKSTKNLDEVLFDEWVREMDKKYNSEGRKVVLVTTIALPILKLRTNQVVFPPTEHNFSDSPKGPGCDSLIESTVP